MPTASSDCHVPGQHISPNSTLSTAHDWPAVLDKVRSFSSGITHISELPGGLTNRNYRVDIASASYVARISAPSSALLQIDRDAEFDASCAAAEVGIAPQVAEYLPSDGVLVIEWLTGTTLTPADLANSDTLSRVAKACRTLHRARPFSANFDMFDIQRRYLQLVTERGFRLPPDYLDYLDKAVEIETALDSQEQTRVPCHNDLLASNMIDDGEQIWLLDFEYAGNNDPYFELGNMSSESGFSTDQLEFLLAEYFGSVSKNSLARARLFGLMSDYGWTLWASIQDGASDLDFDYWSWGMQKYERAVAAFNATDFDQLLADAHRTE